MTSVAQERAEKFRIGRVFSNSFAVITRNLGFLAVVVGLFSTFPALLYNIWNLSRLAGIVNSGTAEDFETLAVEIYPATTLIAGLVIFVLALLVQAALVRAAIEDLNGKRPSIGDCIQIALRSFFPTLGIGILVILALVVAVFVMVFIAWAIPPIGWLIGLALALIPALIWLLSVSVSVPIAVQERLGVFGSISRSRALTKGSRWSIFWLLLIIGVAAMLIQTALSLFINLGLASTGGITGIGIIVAAIGSSLVSTIFSTVLSVTIAVTYVELRQVKEGTSVDELAEIFS
ncbi:hypothetical protein FJV76_25785 [Mesorhizobium sp. WSM4303]|uniref:hypothetical protein n=1 Tax=unclassified Mesorhizobium TaxID=325217 RepID=UPI00115D7EA5|nr:MULTISPECIES: hypothetical protein [unclassified Mesorhizobium]TRC90856.1 hypothetical protein FJV77_27530 [Mesorhizobium sp. WSM4306]TRC98571.1 hypothetical protein FJV76_25785 [Mesorhizobium sp. WSM4303]